MPDDLWLAAPDDAYAQWQREEATGADRRAFADQSIVQHRSMFSRFNDYLIARHTTVASYGADHLDGFFTDLAQDCAPGTTTRLRLPEADRPIYPAPRQPRTAR